MHNRMRKLALLCLAGMLALGLLTLVWAIGIGSSEAQQGAMHNCPQAGKCAFSVWHGPDGTNTEEALATCGAEAVDAAYYIDPETQVWQRWFAARPEISNLTAVNNMQGVIARGSWATLASSSPGSLAFVAQEGGMQNCPQPGRWAISVWGGPDGTEPDDAMATCVGPGPVIPVIAAYYLDPDTQSWQRWFRDRPEISNMPPLDNMQAVVALGDLLGESCAPVVPGTYNGAVTVGGALAPDGTTITASIEGIVWGTATASSGRYVVDIPMTLPATAPCFPGWGTTVTFACDSGAAAETVTWTSGLSNLDLSCEWVSSVCGDVNCDDVVDAVDALFILQHVVGLRPELCVCPGP